MKNSINVFQQQSLLLYIFNGLTNLTPAYIYDLISPSLNDDYSLRSCSKGNQNDPLFQIQTISNELSAIPV